MRARRDLSFIEIVAAESGAITVISHYGRQSPAAPPPAVAPPTETVHYVTRSRIATLILNAPLFSFTPQLGPDRDVAREF